MNSMACQEEKKKGDLVTAHTAPSPAAQAALLVRDALDNLHSEVIALELAIQGARQQVGEPLEECGVGNALAGSAMWLGEHIAEVVAMAAKAA